MSVTGFPPFWSVIVCDPLAYVPPTMPTLAEPPFSETSLKIGSLSGNVPPTLTSCALPLTEIVAVFDGVAGGGGGGGGCEASRLESVPLAPASAGAGGAAACEPVAASPCGANGS